MSSDTSMDQEWKPTKMRPQSTMAQDFSTALDSAFSLDSDVNHLSQTIDQKKQAMMIQSRELEELQQRIRDAENRLKSRQSVNFGTSSAGRNLNNEGQTAAPREATLTEQPEEAKVAESETPGQTAS